MMGDFRNRNRHLTDTTNSFDYRTIPLNLIKIFESESDAKYSYSSKGAVEFLEPWNPNLGFDYAIN